MKGVKFFLFMIMGLELVTAGTAAAEEPSSKMSSAYIRQEVGKYGPTTCGMSVVQFRVETARAMQKSIEKQERALLFATPDGRPYPFTQLYIEDLIELRDLLRVDDDARKDAWDEEIRKAAHAAYERIRTEGRLR